MQLNNMADPKDRLKTTFKQQVSRWVKEAQRAFSAKLELIVKSFQVTGISLALEGHKMIFLASPVMKY